MKTALATNEFPISEVFGPTVQGEGATSGQRAVFIRLMYCNLSCCDCDSAYTWDGTRFDLDAETTVRTDAELLAWTASQPVDRVVITGGEPLLHRHRLVPLVRGLVESGRQVEIETNGTIAPGPDLLAWVTQFNVSPKLSTFGAGMPASRRIKPGVLKEFAVSGKSVFKFVVSTVEDLDEVTGLRDEYSLDPVFVMPEGRTATKITRRLAEIADPAIARGFHLTTRLHVLTWGDQRGR